MGATPASPILLPHRGPTKKAKIWLYISRPGDVLFFPESYAHIVYTHKGPNVLINYRHLGPINFFRQPFTFLTAAFNMRFFGESLVPAKSNIQEVSVPEKVFNRDVYQKLDNVCVKGGITPFDQQLIDILEKSVKP